MKLDEVQERLQNEGITESIQMVRRWVREGKLKATRSNNRKAGYTVEPYDLEEFIQQHKGQQSVEMLNELKLLREENERLKKELTDEQGRNELLNREVFKLSDQIDHLRKEAKINWKKKYEDTQERAKNKADELIRAKAEIEILKMKLRD